MVSFRRFIASLVCSRVVPSGLLLHRCLLPDWIFVRFSFAVKSYYRHHSHLRPHHQCVAKPALLHYSSPHRWVHRVQKTTPLTNCAPPTGALFSASSLILSASLLFLLLPPLPISCASFEIVPVLAACKCHSPLSVPFASKCGGKILCCVSFLVHPLFAHPIFAFPHKTHKSHFDTLRHTHTSASTSLGDTEFLCLFIASSQSSFGNCVSVVLLAKRRDGSESESIRSV